MDRKSFSTLFSLLSLKAADDSANGCVTQGIMVVPNALGKGREPAIVTESSGSSCLTLTAYYPLEKPVYIAALSSQGIARFKLSSMNSIRSMVATGGVDEREGSFYLYVTVDTPLEPESRESLYAELYGMVDTLAGHMGVRFGKPE